MTALSMNDHGAIIITKIDCQFVLHRIMRVECVILVDNGSENALLNKAREKNVVPPHASTY